MLPRLPKWVPLRGPLCFRDYPLGNAVRQGPVFRRFISKPHDDQPRVGDAMLKIGKLNIVADDPAICTDTQPDHQHKYVCHCIFVRIVSSITIDAPEVQISTASKRLTLLNRSRKLTLASVRSSTICNCISSIRWCADETVRLSIRTAQWAKLHLWETQIERVRPAVLACMCAMRQ